VDLYVRLCVRLGPGLVLCLALVSGLGCQALPLNDLDAPPARSRATSGNDRERDRDRDEKVHRAQADSTDSDPAPGQRSAPRGPFGLPPLSELLDDSPEEDSAQFPEARDDPTQPDIRKPGPDTANFPNSPFTLPQGRLFIETSPLFYSGRSVGSPRTYNAEFLIRYGLTDRVELRFFGNGPTFERGRDAASGFGPLAWDLKMNFWKENQKYHIPAVGLEVFILTPTGSPGLNQNVQPSLNLLFEHTLPFGFELEWNVGIVGDPSPNNNFSQLEPAAAWALQHEIVEDFDVFFQGYFNGPTLPRFGDGVVLGAGAAWAVNHRLAIFGSCNGGVTKAAPSILGQFGFALAF
jgi:hypothetical protein